MAARSDAAATPGPKDGAFMSFHVVCSSPNIVDLPPIHKEFSPEHIYDRQSLLDIGNAYKHKLSPAAAEKLQGLCLLLKPDLETAASPTDATKNSLQFGQRMLPQHYRTAFSAQTGTCLKRRSPTTTTQTCRKYTETVTAYIKKCIDDVTVTKTITTRANQKLWMTAEVRGLLKTRDEAFRSGDKAALKTARANLYCGIKNAKRSYAQKINNHFTDSRDTRSLWQALKNVLPH